MAENEHLSSSDRDGPPASNRRRGLNEELDRRMFSSWPILGAFAVVFGLSFGAAAVMIGVLFDGQADLSAGVWAISAAAAVGFLALATHIRREMNIVRQSDS